MADVPVCTQFGNYDPRKIHVSGRKYVPYDITLAGIVYSNGSTVRDTTAVVQPAVQSAPAIARPPCGCS